MRVLGFVGAIFALAFQATATPLPRCNIKQRSWDTHHIDVSCPLSDHVRFIGLGDWGESFETPYVLAVRDAVLKEAATNKYDFILTVGDNIYDNGVNSTTDPLWESIWRKRWHIGTDLKLPWLTTLGNHDHYESYEAQIAFHDSKQPGAQYWYMPSTRYSINIAAKHKMFKLATVDTYILNTTDIDWLAQEYLDPFAEFVLTVGHHQMYSLDERGDNKDPMMLKLNDVMQSSQKNKAYLCGHEHSMQYFTDKQHDYFLFGGSGRTISKQVKFPTTRAHTVYNNRNYGFSLFDIDVPKHTMTVTYVVYDVNGKEIDRPKFTRQY